MDRRRSGAADRARARRVQPRARRAYARANGDSPANARANGDAPADACPCRNDARRDARADANACARRAYRDTGDRGRRDAYAYAAPDSAVRVTTERSGASGADAYASPNAPVPNCGSPAAARRDCGACPYRDPD